MSKRAQKRRNHKANKAKRKEAEKAQNPVAGDRQAELDDIKLEIEIASAARKAEELELEAALRREKLTQELELLQAKKAEAGADPPVVEEVDVEDHLQQIADNRRKEVKWLTYGLSVATVDNRLAKLGGLAWGAVFATWVGRRVGFWPGAITFGAIAGGIVGGDSEVTERQASRSVPGCNPELVGYLIMRYPDNWRRDNLSALTLASKLWCQKHVDWDELSTAEIVRKSIQAYQRITCYEGLGETVNGRAPSWLSVFVRKDPCLGGLGLAVQSVRRELINPLIMAGAAIRSLSVLGVLQLTAVGLVSLTATAYITKYMDSQTAYSANEEILTLVLTEPSYGQLGSSLAESASSTLADIPK
jgi:hypothetical protein